ncbi:histidine kinase [Flavobacterium dauae]|uniref:histidine kinase n=1 Tax=Flavobacterium dauae TaxID=1563479 RepID=UPI00101B2CCD|nr:histidine kinase [Flavobacterium dauae]WLD22609.1 histidine kinase [Flavobacterium dauae]
MKTFLKHLKQFSIILIICYILVVILNYNFNNYYETYSYLRSFIIVFTYTFAIYLANTLILSDYYLKREKNLTNFLIGALLVNILTVIIVFIIEIIGNLIFSDFEMIKALKLSLRQVVFTSWFSMTISTIVYIVLIIRKKDKQEVTQQKTIAVKATTSFETLKNQLDPHFLFNSLNVLSALIEENPKKAQEFTVALSKIYRYVLDQKDKNLISVEEELNFAKLYVSLLKMRFEEALIVNFQNIDLINDYKIVPLSLQLLLENAIKHNIISDKKPLQIDIFQQDNYVVVQNTLQKKQTLEQSSGIGLKNILQRYTLVTNKLVEIAQENNTYTVKLPFVSSDSLFNYQEDLITNEIFENAYNKMHNLKEFYVTIWITVIGFPCYYLINLWYYPTVKWSVVMGFFMLFALIINGIKALNILQKWEQKMIKKQINKQ